MAEQTRKLTQEEVIERLVSLEKRVLYREMPSLVRFDKNVSLSPGVRLRFESTENFGTLGDASITGELSAVNAVIYTTPTSGTWIPIKSYSSPLTIALAANSNNQSIATSTNALADYILLNNTSGGSVDLTGIVAGPTGMEIVLLNISADNVVIKNNATSTAANRFFNTSGADVTLAQHASIRFRYRNDASRTAWQQTA